MKIIDLLNKIANGEEVPKEIRYRGCLFAFDNEMQDYYCERYGNLFEYLISEEKTSAFLNNKVEIVGVDKIKKIKLCYSPDIDEEIFYEDGDKPNHCILGDAGTKLLINKINEIIDKLNEEDK